MLKFKGASRDFVVNYPLDKKRTLQALDKKRAFQGKTPLQPQAPRENVEDAGTLADVCMEDYSQKFMCRSSETVKRTHPGSRDMEPHAKKPCIEIVDELLSQTQNPRISINTTREPGAFHQNGNMVLPIFDLPMKHRLGIEDLPHPNKLGSKTRSTMAHMPAAKKRSRRNSVEHHIQQLWQKQAAWGKKTTCAVDKRLKVLHKAKIFDTPGLRPTPAASVEAITSQHPSLQSLVHSGGRQEEDSFTDYSPTSRGIAPALARCSLETPTVQRPAVITSPARRPSFMTRDTTPCPQSYNTSSRQTYQQPANTSRGRENVPSPNTAFLETSNRHDLLTPPLPYTEPSLMETDGLYQSITQMAACSVPPSYNTSASGDVPVQYRNVAESENRDWIEDCEEDVDPNQWKPHFMWSRDSRTVIENSHMHQSIRISVTARNVGGGMTSKLHTPSRGDVSASPGARDSSMATPMNIPDSMQHLDAGGLPNTTNTPEQSAQSYLTSTPVVQTSQDSPLKMSPIGYQPNLSPIIETSLENISQGLGRVIQIRDKLAPMSPPRPVED